MKILKHIAVSALFLLTIQVSAQINVEQQTKKFGWIDSDKNNELSIAEMEAFHEGKTDKKGRPVNSKGIFYGLDANDDDKLTLDEFTKPINWKKANAKLKGKNSGKQKANNKTDNIKTTKVELNPGKVISSKDKQKFGWVDLDKNNEISLEELIAFYKGKTNKKGEPIPAKLRFYGLDNNDDGKLTIEEYSQPINWKQANQKMKLKKN